MPGERRGETLHHSLFRFSCGLPRRRCRLTYGGRMLGDVVIAVAEKKQAWKQMIAKATPTA